MPVLHSQRELRACQRLPFCYLCGEGFGPEAVSTRDHVPPKAIFACKDRVNPLILPAHTDCNERESVRDELLGQLVALLHGRRPAPGRLRLRVGWTKLPGSGGLAAIMYGCDLRPLVWRCVKGFHAALYKEFLLVDGRANVHLPFPEGRRMQGSKIVFCPILPQQAIIAEELRKNRLAKTIDRLTCWAGRCVYECTWVRSDTGEWLCMFGLRLYNWEHLGDIHHFPRRGCVGLYCASKGRPALGTRGTTLNFTCPTQHPLDPFA